MAVEWTITQSSQKLQSKEGNVSFSKTERQPMAAGSSSWRSPPIARWPEGLWLRENEGSQQSLARVVQLLFQPNPQPHRFPGRSNDRPNAPSAPGRHSRRQGRPGASGQRLCGPMLFRPAARGAMLAGAKTIRHPMLSGSSSSAPSSSSTASCASPIESRKAEAYVYRTIAVGDFCVRAMRKRRSASFQS